VKVEMPQKGVWERLAAEQRANALRMFCCQKKKREMGPDTPKGGNSNWYPCPWRTKRRAGATVLQRVGGRREGKSLLWGRSRGEILPTARKLAGGTKGDGVPKIHCERNWGRKNVEKKNPTAPQGYKRERKVNGSKKKNTKTRTERRFRAAPKSKKEVPKRVSGTTVRKLDDRAFRGEEEGEKNQKAEELILKGYVLKNSNLDTRPEKGHEVVLAQPKTQRFERMKGDGDSSDTKGDFEKGRVGQKRGAVNIRNMRHCSRRKKKPT